LSEKTIAERLGAWSDFLEGPLIGGTFGLVLTLDNLVNALLDDRIQGVESKAIHRFLATEFRPEVLRATGLVIALSILVGSALGGVVSLLEWTRAKWLYSPKRTPYQRVFERFVLVSMGFLWVYLDDVASRPALHQGALFERGGIRKALQILIADDLGRPGIFAIFVVLFFSYLLVPLVRQKDGKPRIKSVIAVSVITLAFGACVIEPPKIRFSVPSVQAASGAHPNVLIIAADSLRPDHLDAQRAPNITSLSKHATSFERTVTPLARTFPAWVSLLTGQYPHHHGIRHMFPRWETRERSFDTLGKRFSLAGYKTAVIGDFAADIFRRIDLGFQTVNTPTFTLRELVREHLFKNDPWLLAWLRGKIARTLVPSIVEMHEATNPWAVTEEAVSELDRADGRPFFLTVFYSTTHFPYATPGPYHQLFRAKDYSGPFRYAKADDLTLDGVVNPSDIKQVRALYDGAVRATDDAIGDLLKALSKRNLSKNTIVVITADHGEQLYEYGRSQGHGDHLEGDEALLVPFILYDPRVSVAHRETNSVSLVDVAPTLLDIAGLPNFEKIDGRSLASSVRGESVESKFVYGETGLWFTEVIAEVPLTRRISYPDLTQLSEVDRRHGDQIVIRKPLETLTVAVKHRMLEWNNYRLLYVPTRNGPVFELYDRATDPGFSRNIAQEHPKVVERLKEALLAIMDEDPMVQRVGETLWPK
jgi:arylsulfatase A-like enzyme